MTKTEIAVAVLLVVMVAAVLYVQRPPGDPETLPLAEAPAERSAPPSSAEPDIRYPIETPVAQAAGDSAANAAEGGEAARGGAGERDADAATAAGESGAGSGLVTTAGEPLPTLDESDALLKRELQSWFSSPSFTRMFHIDRLVRRLVVSVDNLPGRQYPRSNYRVARSVPGQLVVRRVSLYAGDDEKFYLNPDNYARYNRYVDFVADLDSERLVAIYRHYYPLFQAAYEELGYPSAYFNDRLVDVIDHLLAAPDVGGDIRLVRPHVLYKYADPSLESLSAGQKLFIRVGPEHASRLKSKLREVRQLLTATVDETAQPPQEDPGEG